MGKVISRGAPLLNQKYETASKRYSALIQFSMSMLDTFLYELTETLKQHDLRRTDEKDIPFWYFILILGITGEL